MGEYEVPELTNFCLLSSMTKKKKKKRPSQVVRVVKNPPANAEDARGESLTPE